MTKQALKNECDGMIFQTKRDLDYYQYLKELKENDLITCFSLNSFWDEKLNITKYRCKPIMIDELSFQSKTEADYYLDLKHLQQANLIQSFSLVWMQKNNDEKSKYLSKKLETRNLKPETLNLEL